MKNAKILVIDDNESIRLTFKIFLAEESFEVEIAEDFEPVGSSDTVKVAVRVVAATNRNLKEKVEQGDFREDLFYRLKVMEINLPPLREREEDIPCLSNISARCLTQGLTKKMKAFPKMCWTY